MKEEGQLREVVEKIGTVNKSCSTRKSEIKDSPGYHKNEKRSLAGSYDQLGTFY